MELLSPAGSFDSLKAAVQNGADAVYLGGAAFNARQFAENFEHLEEAVAYAHVRGCAIHFTLNTLLLDKDIKKWVQTAQNAARAGIDAFIVQDLGGADLLKRICPDVPLHASTQMTIHHTDAARALKALGFSRIVLARELTKEQIHTIRQNVEIELEVFAHGALCVCYSGQCLMSSLLGGRSANRGACAQPCRLPYRLNGKTGYFLNLKDLCLVDQLSAMREAGIDSIKIEGRMKRPEYVAAVTHIYREALDGRLVTPADREQLLLAFNRGRFTQGLFSHASGRLYPAQPDNLGLFLGKVISSGKNGVLLRSTHTVFPGDEIAPAAPDAQKQKIIRVDQKGENVLLHLPSPAAFHAGADVNLITNQKQLSLFSAAIRANTRQTPLTASFRLRLGQPATLRVSTPGGLCVSVSGALPEPAHNRAITREDVQKQLQKTGDFPFFFDQIEIDLENGCAFPASELNKLRREALFMLSRRTLDAWPRHTPRPYEPIFNRPRPRPAPKLAIQALNERQLLLAAPHADLLYIPLGARWSIPDGAKAVGVYPRITTDRALATLKPYEQDFDTVMMSSMIDSRRNKAADTGMNLTNSESLAALARAGFCRATLSQELNTAQINALTVPASLKTELVVYGRATLMVTQHCPVACHAAECAVANGSAILTDRKGMSFPLIPAGEDCRVAILNALPLYMADRLSDLSADVLRLQFTTESPEECAALAYAYRQALMGIPPANHPPAYTRGHFNRGF